MKLREKLDPLSELQAIRIQYGLSYENVAFELREHVPLSTATVFRMLSSGRARDLIVHGIDRWLSEVGRRRYPLEGLSKEANP